MYFHYVLIHRSSEMQEKSFLFSLTVPGMCCENDKYHVIHRTGCFTKIHSIYLHLDAYWHFWICLYLWQNHTAGAIIEVWSSSLIVPILLIICKKFTQKISCCPPVLHYSKDLTNHVNSHGHCRIIFKDSVHMKS